MAMKPLAPKPIGSGKKKPTRRPTVKLRGTPVPLAEYKPKRVPGQPVPAPMPTRVPNLSLPKDQRAKARPMGPAGPKKKSSGMATPKPKATKKATPTAKPTKKGLTVTLGNGGTMDLNTGIKTIPKPTPKPLATMSNKEYFRKQKEFLAQQKKAKGK